MTTTPEKLLEIGIKKRNGDIVDSWSSLAENFGDGMFSDGEQYRLWVKNRLRTEDRNKNKTASIKEDFKESIEINKDGSQSSIKLIKMSIEDSKDVNYLLKAHGYDTDLWELTSARSNIWNSYSKKDGIMQLYSSKISVKPKKDELSLESIRSTFKEMSDMYIRPSHNPVRYSKNGMMLEISIADIHLGKLAWQGDSNDTYNWEIARERFFHIINDVLTRTQSYKFEKILFCWSNDFFHYDGLTKTTTGGTPQDTDLKFAQMYKIGTKMLIEAVDLLSQFAPVETFYVGANHDKLTSYVATEHLAAWFRNDTNVKVDTDPKIRKYIEFGKCLIQFSHGHAEGKRIGEVMPVEAREAWGRTVYHEVHAGHFHSERTVTKDNGVIVRYLNSPTGADTWHYESGYVGALKVGQSFIWDRELGLMDAIYTTVE
ncbi:hypothetical protein NST33_18520 [Paenibacillus sp. FSL L8-0435]|uniref:hypothetical protein n=1 Tax=Paenibacillus sp. FSL L8-0435 TaxID=2954618 RepID=UPI0030DBD941